MTRAANDNLSPIKSKKNLFQFLGTATNNFHHKTYAQEERSFGYANFSFH